MRDLFVLEPGELLEDAENRQKSMLEQLEALVSIESPSEDKSAVDRASRVVAGWFEDVGGKIRWHRQKKFGDLLEIRFGAMGGDRTRVAMRGASQFYC